MPLQHLLEGLQINEVPDISNVQRVSDQDRACLKELRAVLRRHGLTGKFGIALLHKHFDLAEDEVLVERCDTETRTLVASPMRRAEIRRDKSITTLWKFSDDDDDNEKECAKECPDDEDDEGNSRHSGFKDHM